jgi:hypothetical protein
MQFTDRAHRIMILAWEEAERLRHEQVDSGHLLLGIIKEGSGAAAFVLRDLGVNPADVRREVEELRFLAGPGTAADGEPSYTPAAKKLLQDSLEEARSLNHDFADDLHLLLAMLRDRDGALARVLFKVELDPTAVRAAILQHLVPPGDLEKRGRPLPPHISAGPLGRTVLGLCAFICSLVIGAAAIGLIIMLITVGPPPIFWQAVLVHVLIDSLAIISIFMLFLAVSFWTGGARWIEPLLSKVMPKGIVCILTVVGGFLAVVSAHLIAIVIAGHASRFLAGVLVVIAMTVVVTAILVQRKRSHSRLKQDR